MQKTLVIFKLFNSIKDAHEVTFAELELRSLLGSVDKVRNLVDVIEGTPLKFFCDENTRFQDVLTYELCYGEYQGFTYWSENLPNMSRLVRRLAYSREIYVITPGSDETKIREEAFPEGIDGRNVASYSKEGYILLRIIPNQFFLEKSAYVSKLSRNESEVDICVDLLFRYPFEELYRIPASATMAVGKRLQDYFTIREEVSLYLTHVWYPYKAKFHAKMVRAILNYVAADDDSVVMDNWAGSGTLNVEASIMGLRNLGLELNPFSSLMANVKCQALTMRLPELKKEIETFINELSLSIATFNGEQRAPTLLQVSSGSSMNAEQDERAGRIMLESEEAKRNLKGLFTDEQIREFLIARDLINEKFKDQSRNFMLLALGGSISDLARRRKGRLLEVMTLRLYKLMYLRLYLFHRLNETMGINIGESETFVGDNRDPFNSATATDGKKANLEPCSVDAIVTSPPYSTAVDYIRNDYPQLVLLGLAKTRQEFEDLEKRMEGNPKPRLYRDPSLVEEVSGDSEFYKLLPEEAKGTIQKLRKAGREPEAIRSYKFFKDMFASLAAMNKLLKPGGRCAIVIGNNHYKVSETEEEEVKNDIIIFKLALRDEIGFGPDKHTGGIIRRPIEKTQTGYVRQETVLVLEKIREAETSVSR